MPTQNPRVNITFDNKTANILNSLSKHEHKSISSVARDLILEALELREDLALSALAEIREVKKSKMIKHQDAWK